MIALQKDFSAGINLLVSDTALADNEYLWLINGRQRFGVVDPIKKHIKDATLPAGKKQGIIAVGNVLIVFITGLAYYREAGVATWTQIPDFFMSPTVDEFWTQEVPASTFHFVRKANQNIHNPALVTTDFKASGTPQCVVVQDGVNQPFLIIYDEVNQVFTAREAKRYTDWQNKSTSANDREYVPVGKQMMYLDGILFIVAPDGRSVYRSVTGRPLDFMVNVDTNGNKMPSESQGGATSVSFAFDFNEITCLVPVNTPSSFLYATAKNSRIITLDYARTIFGEPLFYVAANINAGVANQYAVTEVLGDYTFVDKEGVKAFNAVLQLKFKGRNTNFSLQVSKLLRPNYKQQRPVCIQFNNYALYNLDTIFGNIFVVYDTLINKWVAFDITELSNVKQFAIVETDTESQLFAITTRDELWQMFASSTKETYMVRTKSFVSEDTSVEHKSQYLRPVFNGGTSDGEVTLVELVDEKESLQNRVTLPLTVVQGGVNYPVRPPVMPSTQSRVDNPQFTLTKGLTGKKISYILICATDATLVEYKIETSEVTNRASQKQQTLANQNTYGA